ncbi:MAG: anthranilate phosphoribosyltransferase [Flavobacteriaceae bacterium]
MKKVLESLHNHHVLNRNEAKELLTTISHGVFNSSQIASFLTIYLMRKITIEELAGFRDALLELCIPVGLSAYDPIDLCGTGGDGKNTFNISTLASFVVAGAGVKVAKHGNYGVSSMSGSSNVMEKLGYQFTNNLDKIKKQIEESNICFLHAPLFHPAMKLVAPIRKELGVKTFFNMLGPMVNPAKPNKQIVGVYSLELLRLYKYLYQQSDKKYSIIYSLDGYDEISLTSNFRLVSNTEDSLKTPEDYFNSPLKQEQLFGGNSVKESAKIFTKIISGKGTEAQNNVVIANAATAIQVSTGKSLEDSFEAAKESLNSGNAMVSLKKLIAI